MYSSYWTPSSGRKSTVLTDHEALRRDEATHRNIQSNETKLRPLDLETIMSSKAAVKYWYLHRPKTMEYVHSNAVKIQSVGRAFAVRALIKKHGIEYMVELAKADAERRERDRLAEMSVADRQAAEEANEEYEARVAETRRLRKERMEMEQAEEDARRMRAAILAEEARKAEEARLRREEEERQAREEEERQRQAAMLAKQQEEEAAAAAAAALAAQAVAEQQAVEEAERLRQEQELEAQRELEKKQREEEDKRRGEQAAAVAAAAAAKEAEEAERARLAAIEAEKMAAIQAEKMEKYEQSLSKDVPVRVQGAAAGRVVHYDKDEETYDVVMEVNGQEQVVKVTPSDVELDDDRILSPRTKVDTPFGTGEVVGLDPHVGCYAVKTDVNAPEGEQFLAFAQIKDVHVHEEEEEERAIVEDSARPLPDEIGLVSARIVDYRVVNKKGKKFIQYKLEIKTNNYGTVYCWKRYSTFRTLCERLHKEAGFKKKDIPELPKRQIIGNFSSKTLKDRAEKLNSFLYAAVKAENLQWGIRVDDQIAVYKRRVKKPGFFSRRR